MYLCHMRAYARRVNERKYTRTMEKLKTKFHIRTIKKIYFNVTKFHHPRNLILAK